METIEINRTIKSRIIFENDKDIPKMVESQEAFRQGCNFVSEYMFNNGFPMNTTGLIKILYNDLRSKFGLKSQMAQSCVRTVIARYRSVQAQLRKEYVWDGYKKDNHGKQVKNYVLKTLEYLWYPIEFKRPQLDLVRNRDYSYKDDGTMTLNTIYGRVIVTPTFKGFEQYFDGSWKLGTAKVLKSGKHWYLHIAVTKQVEQSEFKSSHVVGIDRGLRQLLTIYDEKGRTTFVNGKQILQKRRQYKRLRKELQSKGTKSAKRRLKAIGERESRWMSDVNHCLAKTLVNRYGSGTIFVLEDLTGVTFDTVSKRSKKNRYEHHSWSFYDFEQKLTYKAVMNNSQVIKCDAHYTSQRCPKCGLIDSENRNKTKHEFCCKACSYRTNDDRAAAMNIQFLGTLYNSGNPKPSFEKLEIL
jgi:IS605 OrfB family transposase